MRTASNVLRIGFILVAFVAHARLADADSWWYVQCNTYCTGEIKIHECNFWDLTGPSDCNDAYATFDAACYNEAASVGQQGLYTFGLSSCSDGGGSAQGESYCSYTDFNCPD